MGQDPDAIRQEIDQTRDRMGDTVDALGYKADVPSRAKDSISERVDAVKSKITGVGSQVSEATPDAADVAGRSPSGWGGAGEPARSSAGRRRTRISGRDAHPIHEG